MFFRWVLILFLVFPGTSFAKIVTCSLPIVSQQNGCYNFQADPYIILFNQWDAAGGCDEIKLSIDLDQSKILMTPYKSGAPVDRVASTKSRLFVVETNESTIINYNPGSRNTIMPMLILLDKTYQSAVIYWMYSHNGSEKYGPYNMKCGL